MNIPEVHPRKCHTCGKKIGDRIWLLLSVARSIELCRFVALLARFQCINTSQMLK